MSAIVKCKFVLQGPRKGETVELGGRQFVDGVLEVQGAQQDVAALGRYLEANGWALPEGAAVPTGEDTNPGNPEGKLPDPDGENERLRAAVLGLDANDDDAWTNSGKPAMEAVQKAYGAADVTRAQVEGLCPGYDRVQAREQQGKNVS